MKNLEYYYSTLGRRLNTLLDPDNADMWSMIVDARKEWVDYREIGTFWDHLESEYGIMVKLDENNDICLPVTIIDESKYLVFVLRYR